MRLGAAPLATSLNSGTTRGRMLRGLIRRSGSDHELRRLPTSLPEARKCGTNPPVADQLGGILAVLKYIARSPAKCDVHHKFAVQDTQTWT